MSFEKIKNPLEQRIWILEKFVKGLKNTQIKGEFAEVFSAGMNLVNQVISDLKRYKEEEQNEPTQAQDAEKESPKE